MIDIQKQTIKNDLRVLTASMASVKSATVLLLVKAGSRYETKDLNGIAHFAEHMFFKGTKKRPTAVEIASLIDGLGAEFNAFTSKEYTGFYIKAASSHLELVTEVLSDMLLNSKFDQEEIDRERNVIGEELRMYLDTPMRYVGDIYEELLYGDQPLGWDTVGTLKSLQNIQRDDFLSYNSKYYLGPNMIFVVGGDVTADKGKALAEKYFAPLPKKPSPAFNKAKFDQKKPAIKLFYKDSEQAHLALGVRSLPLGNPERYKIAVLNSILGSSMSSRLFIQLRERRGLAYYVRSGSEEYHDAGSFSAQAGVEPKNINEAIKVLLAEFGKITQEKVSEAELKKAKDSLTGRLILELEDSRDVSTMVGLQELLEDKIRTPEEIIAKVNQVTSEEITDIASRLFVNQGLNLAIIGPFKEEAKFSKDLKF
ncbi:MAG TPA: pitrilysin family protein [Candidatus Saccharimonadales bacterium]|nr:pitrilysin family protein [Candidatus Saccharimonadales bacterium]